MRKGTKHTKETKDKISKTKEIYTEDFMLELLPKMVKFVKTKIKGSDNEKVHLKMEILVHFEIWNRGWFSEMGKKFAENKKVSQLLRACDMICEVNSYKAGANGNANPVLVKANLAHHYNWQDKAINTTKETKEKTDEEIAKEIAEYEKRNK
jgi:hypothetical protein